MKEIKNTKYSKKNPSAIIAQRYARFRRLRSSIKTKRVIKLICGRAVILPDKRMLVHVFVDKNFNLVPPNSYPSIELLMEGIAYKKNPHYYVLKGRQNAKRDQYVQIKRK
jgi:hypothetical protein